MTLQANPSAVGLHVKAMIIKWPMTRPQIKMDDGWMTSISEASHQRAIILGNGNEKLEKAVWMMTQMPSPKCRV